MKKFLTVIAVLISSQASAAQYNIYVNNASHVSPAQSELSAIVQKHILVDSTAKTLSFQLTAPCAQGEMCPMFLRAITLKLAALKVSHGQIVSLRAEGTLDLNGKPTQAMVQIDLNADNALDIVITNSSECKSTHSNFLGAPAAVSAATVMQTISVLN